jgi:predicted CxxxxCH...CXXCH cytochrome family protein
MERPTAERIGATDDVVSRKRSLLFLLVFVPLAAQLACSGGSSTSGGGDSSTTGTPSPTPTDGHTHPAGYAAASVHGPDMKKQFTDCRTCHGAQLDGGTSAISCDGCHSLKSDGTTPEPSTTAWRTDCTFCHGGTDNALGAPPRDLNGATAKADMTFTSHTKHVTADSVHVAYDCVQCHVKPVDVLSTGHAFDSTKIKAEVNFTAGISQFGIYGGTQSCSNLYCHGNGLADNGTYDGHFSPTDCNSCHPTNNAHVNNLSGKHDLHLNGANAIICSDCHSNTVSTSNAIINAALHINKVKNYAMAGITYAGGTCNGNCHGKGHSNLPW